MKWIQRYKSNWGQAKLSFLTMQIGRGQNSQNRLSSRVVLILFPRENCRVIHEASFLSLFLSLLFFFFSWEETGVDRYTNKTRLNLNLC